MYGEIVEEYHPTSGHFSFNPLIVDQSDDYFYQGVEMKLMFENGLQVKAKSKRFYRRCKLDCEAPEWGCASAQLSKPHRVFFLIAPNKEHID